MFQILKSNFGRRALLCGAGLLLVAAIAAEARAFHRRAVVVYGAGYGGAAYYPPAYVGPGSFNPVGFGFGGYSYGGYPYYGYYGYLPGVYAGYGGVAAAPGYATCPYTVPLVPAATPVCAPACPVIAPAPAPCEPVCMTRCAYRRYMRQMCRAMAQCGYPCLPTTVNYCYGAMLGADAYAADEIGAATEIESDMFVGEPIGPQALPTGEQVAPPAEDETPQPMLERSL